MKNALLPLLLLALTPIKGIAEAGQSFDPDDHDLTAKEVNDLVACGAVQVEKGGLDQGDTETASDKIAANAQVDTGAKAQAAADAQAKADAAMQAAVEAQGKADAAAQVVADARTKLDADIKAFEAAQAAAAKSANKKS